MGPVVLHAAVEVGESGRLPDAQQNAPLLSATSAVGTQPGSNLKHRVIAGLSGGSVLDNQIFVVSSSES